MRPAILAFAAAAALAAAIAATPAAPTPAACGWKTFQLGVPRDRVHRAGISDVAAVSPRDVWAVGGWTTPLTGQRETLIEHWTSRHWDVVPSPDPLHNLVSAVAAGRGDAWAVGRGSRGALTLHWNGTRWSVVRNPGGNEFLTDVAMISRRDVWAIGPAAMLHWDGSRWSKVVAPAFGQGVSPTALAQIPGTSRVWVYGYDHTGASPSQLAAALWTGSGWQKFSLPGKPGASSYNLVAGTIAATSAASAWIVTSAENTAGIPQTYVLHWDGSAWAAVPSPNPRPPGDFLYAVSARSASDVWAVGSDAKNTTSLVIHWDGSSWSLVRALRKLASGVATVPGSRVVWLAGGTLDEYQC